MVSLGIILAICMTLLIIAGAITIGIVTWSSGTTMTPETYIWSIGNGEQQFVTSSPILYPYTKTLTQVALSLTVSIPSVTPTTASLPILVSLPVSGSSLHGTVLFSSHVLPAGQTSIQPVLYNSTHVAFQYIPSGQLATGAELTTSWTLIFQVIYNIL